MAFVKHAYITSIPVYQYRVGREGQSVDLTGLKKHYKENLSVLRTLVSFYNELPGEANNALTVNH